MVVRAFFLEHMQEAMLIRGPLEIIIIVLVIEQDIVLQAALIVFTLEQMLAIIKRPAIEMFI